MSVSLCCCYRVAWKGYLWHMSGHVVCWNVCSSEVSSPSKHSRKECFNGSQYVTVILQFHSHGSSMQVVHAVLI